jgi:hypothetical protein
MTDEKFQSFEKMGRIQTLEWARQMVSNPDSARAAYKWLEDKDTEDRLAFEASSTENIRIARSANTAATVAAIAAIAANALAIIAIIISVLTWLYPRSA